jgi:hypothetical protein
MTRYPVESSEKRLEKCPWCEGGTPHAESPAAGPPIPPLFIHCIELSPEQISRLVRHKTARGPGDNFRTSVSSDEKWWFGGGMPGCYLPADRNCTGKVIRAYSPHDPRCTPLD